MNADTPVDSLETLIGLSAPARIFIGPDIASHCWPLAARFLHTWHELRSGKVAPERADLTPMKISEALPFLTIFDVEYDPFRLKCRLMGSAFANAIGYDATGNYVDSYPHTEALTRRAKWVIGKVQPMLITGLPLAWSPEKDYKTYDTLSLPFMGDGDKVEAILYLNQFHAPEK
ncbi:PAS domain-containing protein [Kordiimonas lipolytica]|uniref:PAS domain-containing protein n=1 Tax=Kordiimonas lipolytica TaxID=1662421 RepID=A0ABV8UCH2_9PROT|nr:PAS domain-containing protein [Kordiimonas lipolytica]